MIQRLPQELKNPMKIPHENGMRLSKLDSGEHGIFLTEKGRPPCSDAGVEMYERMTDKANELDDFIEIEPEPRLIILL